MRITFTPNQGTNVKGTIYMAIIPDANTPTDSPSQLMAVQGAVNFATWDSTKPALVMQANMLNTQYNNFKVGEFDLDNREDGSLNPGFLMIYTEGFEEQTNNVGRITISYFVHCEKPKSTPLGVAMSNGIDTTAMSGLNLLSESDWITDHNGRAYQITEKEAGVDTFTMRSIEPILLFVHVQNRTAYATLDAVDGVITEIRKVESNTGGEVPVYTSTQFLYVVPSNGRIALDITMGAADGDIQFYFCHTKSRRLVPSSPIPIF